MVLARKVLPSTEMSVATAAGRRATRLASPTGGVSRPPECAACLRSPHSTITPPPQVATSLYRVHHTSPELEAVI